MIGDKLASGSKSAQFSTGGARKGEPIQIAPGMVTTDEPEELVSHIDNSSLFKTRAELVQRYRGRPLGDRVLVKRIKQSQAELLVVDTAELKQKSEKGIVTGVGDGVIDLSTGKRTPVNLSVGDLILFDRFAAVGQEVELADDEGIEVEHLILAASDVLLILEKA